MLTERTEDAYASRCDLDGWYVYHPDMIIHEAKVAIGKLPGKKLKFAGWDVRIHPSGKLAVVGWARDRGGRLYSTERIPM